MIFHYFNDTISTKFQRDDLCGPIIYDFIDPKPFLKLVPPSKNPSIEGRLEVSTNAVIDVGIHKVTLQARLSNFPTSTPARIEMNVKINSIAVPKIFVSKQTTDEAKPLETVPKDPVIETTSLDQVTNEPKTVALVTEQVKKPLLPPGMPNEVLEMLEGQVTVQKGKMQLPKEA